MEQAEKTVTVKTFDLPVDASMAMHKLQLEGIPCFLTNEHMASAFAMPLNPLFAIELKVFESDLIKAGEILSDAKTILSSVCPKCGSHEIQFTYSKSLLPVWALC